MLQRNKYYIVIYRGKDFLPTSVAAVLAEREELTKDIQDVEEKARIAPVNPTRVDAAINERQEFVKDDKIFEGKAHCGAVEEVDAGAVEGQALAGTLAEFLEAQARWGREISDHEREKMKEEAARAKAAQMVKRVEHKLDLVSQISLALNPAKQWKKSGKRQKICILHMNFKGSCAMLIFFFMLQGLELMH